jgi:outer membrane protein assembly factor BamB
MAQIWNSGIVALVLFAGITQVRSADWPMRGRNLSRNAVSPELRAPVNWVLPDERSTVPTPAKNVRWSALLGDQSCGDPVIAGGLIWVGTNNARPRYKAESADASVLMCFREKDGAFLYQYVSPRMDTQRDMNARRDFPLTGLASSPFVESDRLWFCANRSEVICLDVGPLRQGAGHPEVVWKFDMARELGVVPRAIMLGSSASHCSITGYKDLIYVNTANAVAYSGKVPAPNAPSLVCFDRQTGVVRWQDHSPGVNILDVQHGSPLVIEISGGTQVLMGQGDGWLRSFDAITGELLWKFDINFKSTTDRDFVTGKRNDLVAMPVFHDGRVYFATGRQFELCGGPGRLCCVDPTKRGDISSQLDDGSERGRRNPNSGLIWEYVGNGDDPMHCTLSSVAVHNGILIAPDFSGIVHCLDAVTGWILWTHGTSSQISTSPLIVDEKVYVAGDDTISIFELSRQRNLIGARKANGIIAASPIFANGTLYLTTREEMFAISD